MVGQLCDDDIELLQNWKWDRNITAQYGDFITKQGWEDLKYLALDYQKNFESLLEYIYTPNKFQFGYTNTQRTEASFKSFLILRSFSIATLSRTLGTPKPSKAIKTNNVLNSRVFLSGS